MADKTSSVSFNLGGIGYAAAAVLSYVHNHSILWAILHGSLTWFYVGYALLTRTSLASLIH